MNTDYVIQIKTKHGRIWSYRKEKNGWSQTASTGIVRQCTGDQLLSHLLPPLTGDQPGLSVRLERKRRRPQKVSEPRNALVRHRTEKCTYRKTKAGLVD